VVDVHVSIASVEIAEGLELLRREVPRALKDALVRTAHEVREAEAIEVRGGLEFAGPTTERFLAGSFRFDQAAGDRPLVQIRTLPGARDILERQTFGETLEPSEEGVGPRYQGAFAVPQRDEVARTPSGRVPVAKLPSRLTERTKRGRSRGYRAGRAFFLRVPGQKLGRFLYALTSRAVVKPELDFFGVAARTARREFPKKAARVLEKINLRRRR